VNSTSPQPLVSIGIPTYNRANGKLLNVIRRALEQTYQNVEVIVSDNCSSDNTTEVVQSVKDERLKYVRHETNIGANNNFNHCLKEARGEYFLLFHDDDMIDVDFVASCIASLEEGKAVGAIFTGIRIIDGDDNVLNENKNMAKGKSPLEFVLAWFDAQISLYLPSTLYNTEYLKKVGGFNSKTYMYPDLVPTFKLIAAYERSDVEDVKASFRRHDSNLGLSCHVDAWMEDGLHVLDILYELFPNDIDVLKDKGKKYFCQRMYKHASSEPNVFKRYRSYLKIYRAFDYCYSPIKYFYGNEFFKRFFAKIFRISSFKK